MKMMENKNLTITNDDSHKVSPQITDVVDSDLGCSDNGRPKGYSHDKEIGLSNPYWLSRVRDCARLSQLSLPGTHNTMALYGGDSVQCQSMGLRTQLDSGIRVLDIRCRHIKDVFTIHHGMVYQKKKFGEVLNEVKDFLQTNPSETIYMRVKEEYKEENATRGFIDTFRIKYWEPNKEWFWQPSGDNPNPTLSETRGKIVVLQEFTTKPGIPFQRYGIRWKKTELIIQDDYSMKTNWSLYDKWKKVRKHLESANNEKDDKKYVNFLTGSGGSFPYFVASGQSSPKTGARLLLTGRLGGKGKGSWRDFPRVNCDRLGICSIAFEGTNNLVAARIGKGLQFDKRTGIIMADFPGPELIERIIKLNF